MEYQSPLHDDKNSQENTPFKQRHSSDAPIQSFYYTQPSQLHRQKNATWKHTIKQKIHLFIAACTRIRNQITSPNDPMKKPKKPSNNSFWKRINWKKVGIFCGILFLVGIITIFGIFAYFAKDLPNPGQINSRSVAESTKIYDRTGEHLLYEIHGEEKRTIVPFDQIPANVKYATLALEDQDFYQHRGVRPMAIARAALAHFFPGRFGAAGGGSTITQQLVKLSLLTSEQTITRKVKEFILAIEIERKLEKNEIFEIYLNEIPYGSNAYGIESASQTFFGKNAKDLTLDEAALLASLPQAPSRYSPFGSRTELLKGRQEHALQSMVNLGFISQEESDKAKAEDVLSKVKPNIQNIKAPHFVMYIREYLEEKYGQEIIEQGGLKVITTLDWEKQTFAEEIVREGAQANKERYNAENASLVAIEPKTGQIIAMVGSRNFFDEEIDGQVNVAIAERQPGSSFKPYAYLKAFAKGYTPETILYDVETPFAIDRMPDYTPQNYDGTFRGPISIKEALAMSLNIPAVKILYLAGIDDTITLAKSLGITSLNNRDRYGLSLVLGGGEVRLLDHVAAYATLANNGIKNEKTALLRIENNHGDILEEFKRNETRVIEEEYVTILSHVLSRNEYRSSVFGENNPLKYPDDTVAAKTGTTNEFRDAWAMGYSRHMAVGVWTGNNDNRPMSRGADGSYVAAPIFKKFMDKVLEDIPHPEKFPKYDKDKFEREKDILNGKLDIQEDVKVCEIPDKKDTYCLANIYCPDSKVKKKDFANVHTILHFVQIDDPLGDEPKDPENDTQYKKWEKGVREYYEDEDDYELEEAPEDECKADDFTKYLPTISLSAPGSINSNQLTFRASGDAPYGDAKLTFLVNGTAIKEVGSGSGEVTYTVPEGQNNSTLTVEVVLRDKNGNEAKANASVSVSYATTPPPTQEPEITQGTTI